MNLQLMNWISIVALVRFLIKYAKSSEEGNESSFESYHDDLDKEITLGVLSKHQAAFDAFEIDMYSLSSMKHRSPCVVEALQKFIPQCIVHGVDSIDPSVQKYSALKLSICEFENSHIQIPSVCYGMKDPVEYDSCIIQIEKTPQYWATFTGYYREIVKICYEESLPFEKEQILHLYTNVTKVLNRLMKEMHHAYSSSEENSEHMFSGFTELRNMMKDIIRENNDASHVMRDNYNKIFKQYEKVVEDTSQVSKVHGDRINEMMSDVLNTLQFTGFQVSELSLSLDALKFNDKIEEIKESAISEYRNMANISMEATQNIFDQLNSLSKYADETRNSTSNIEMSLQQSESHVDTMKNSLEDSTFFVKHYTELVKFELEHTLNFVADFQKSALDYALEDANSELSKYGDFMDHLNYKLEETNEKLVKVDANVDQLSRHIGNASLFLLDSFHMLTSNKVIDLTSMALDRAKQGIISWRYGLLKVKVYLRATFYLFLVAIVLLFYGLLRRKKNRLHEQVAKSKTIANFPLSKSISEYSYSTLLKTFSMFLLFFSVLIGTIVAYMFTNFLIKLKFYMNDFQVIS
ncbi:Piso0_001737 [Millerozyma farinosa CBS 7064]|uniref:Nuclear fusion protein KAR5 n=1 Tax=Pichia sorbitophila (strain ATCC MYA-4447 / BCRC 22081 / CBS 7064 / NBRC 10061 / NRRL Y-12695) TaxID=559304 RepID=G8YNY7_PICSO|nr:Piso0_001737 [Millerozyma farinosa CBS 7064]